MKCFLREISSVEIGSPVETCIEHRFTQQGWGFGADCRIWSATYCHRYIHMQQHIRPSQSITCHIMMITMYQIIVSYSMYPCFIVQRLFSTHTHIYIYIYMYIRVYISKLEIIWASLPVVVCLDLLQTWSGQCRWLSHLCHSL